jgi:hypothetical protein
MKVLVFGLLFLLLMGLKGNNLYLLTTHDPHITEEIFKYSKIEKNHGRVVLLSITKNLPKKLSKYLRSVSLDDVKVYKPALNSNFIKDYKISNIISDVLPSDVKSIVTKLSSFKSRAAGSEGNYQSSLWIKKQFENMGYDTKLDCFRTKYCNVYAFNQNATIKSNEVVLTEAHLDSVGRVNAGADDNASGIAGLLLMAKHMAKRSTKRSLVFFATNGEEKGLLGAKHYVNKLKNSRTLNQIKFVINMDMIGYNQNGVVDIETNQEFEEVALWYSSLVHTYTTLTPNITIPAWGSDHVPFLKNHIPTILSIEHWKTKTPCYHSSCDKPGHLNYEYAAEIIKLNLAALLIKADQ